MKRASVINFKGGVGKTTLSVHFACFLANNSKVLVIDVDHQSSLSIVLLGDALWSQAVKERKTINRVFESFCNRKISMPGSEIILTNPIGLRNPHFDHWYPNLDFVSAQFELDDTEIDLASTSYGNANLSDWDKRTLLASWLDSVGAHDKYDYILFDCPPATKIVSQNALAASDSYVIPVIPDELSSRGVTHFKNLVESKIDGKLAYLKEGAHVQDADVPKNFVPKTHLAAIVPYLAKYSGNAASGLTNIHTEQIASLRRHWKDDVIKTVGKNMTGVPEATNMGLPVWRVDAPNVTQAVQDMMTSICTEMKTRIDV